MNIITWFPLAWLLSATRCDKIHVTSLTKTKLVLTALFQYTLSSLFYENERKTGRNCSTLVNQISGVSLASKDVWIVWTSTDVFDQSVDPSERFIDNGTVPERNSTDYFANRVSFLWKIFYENSDCNDVFDCNNLKLVELVLEWRTFA